MNRRILSILLCFALVFGLFSGLGGGTVSASAGEESYTDFPVIKEFLLEQGSTSAYVTGISKDLSKVLIGDTEAILVNTDTKEHTPLKNLYKFAPSAVSTDPDLKYVAYYTSSSTAGAKYGLLNTETLESVILNGGKLGLGYPTFSGDGKKLIFIETAGTLYKVISYDLEEGTQTSLTLSDKEVPVPQNTGTFGWGNLLQSNFDGSEIYITTKVSGATKVSLFRIKMDGSSRTEIEGNTTGNIKISSGGKEGRFHYYSVNGSNVKTYIYNTEDNTRIENPVGKFTTSSYSTTNYDVGFLETSRYAITHLQMFKELANIQIRKMYSLGQYVYPQISEDGNTMIMRDLDNKMKLNFYDISSLRQLDGELKNPPAIKNLRIKESAGKDKVVLTWDPNFMATHLEISVNGSPYDSFENIEVSRTLNLQLGRVNEIKARPAIKVGTVTKYGEETTIQYNMEANPSDIVSIGNKKLVKGDYISLGNVKWRVWDENTLITASSVGTIKFDSDPNTSTPSKAFEPSSSTNIGYYLNNSFYSNFNTTAKDLIVSTSWDVHYDGTTNLQMSVLGKVFLPTSNDARKSPFTTESSEFWVMNKACSQYNCSSILWREWDNSTTSSGFFNTKATHAVIKIVPDAIIGTGTGTSSSPYVINSAGIPPVEAEPPAQPTNFKVTKVSDTMAQITWDAVAGVSYQLTDGSSTLFNGVGNSYLLMNVVPNKDYTFVLIPTKDGLTGPLAITTYTFVPQVVPPKEIADLEIVKKSPIEISIKFTPEDGVVYRLQYDDRDDLISYSQTVSQLTPGKTYSFTITQSRDGVAGPSKTFQVTMDEFPEPPTKPTGLSAQYLGEGKVRFEWDAEPGVSYKVSAKSAEGFTVVGEVGTYTFIDLVEGETYNLVVVPRKDNLDGPNAFINFKLPEKPVIPDPELTEVGPVTVKVNKVAISVIEWDKVTGVDGYRILKNGEFVIDLGSDSTSYVNNSPVLGETVTYTVQAKYGDKFTTGSSVTFTIASEMPSIPSGQAINFKVEKINASTLKASWDELDWADQYKLREFNLTMYLGEENSFYITNTDTSIPRTFYLTGRKNDDWAKEVEYEYVPEIELPDDVTYFGIKELDSTSVTLEWDDALDISGYKLYKDGKLYRSFISITNQFKDTNLTPGSTVAYTLKTASGKILSLGTDLTVNVPKKALELSQTEKDSVKYEVNEDGDLVISWEGLEWVDSVNISGPGVSLEGITNPMIITGVNVEDIIDFTLQPVLDGEIVLPFETTYVPAGTKPEPVTGVKATKVYHDGASIQWVPSKGATSYKVVKDNGVVVYTGLNTTFRDNTASPLTEVEYTVFAVNENGESTGVMVIVETPAEPVSIVVSPPSNPPIEGTITVDFRVVDGVEAYYSIRNPQWKFTDNGDGTFSKVYTNTATGAVINHGNVAPVDGKLNFTDEEVIPGEDYHYDIRAVRYGSNGEEIIVGETPVDITTPGDGGGATVPDPGNGGNPGGGNNGGGNNGGGNNGGGNSGGNTGGTNPGDNTGEGNTDEEKGTEEENNSGKATQEELEKLLDGVGKCSLEAKEVNISDIDNHWAKQYIESMIKSGVVEGYPEGTFKPEKDITRAEFVAMLLRALCVDVTDKAPSFSDVSKTAWYYNYVGAAEYFGLVNGTSEDKFSPTRAITRQEIAAVIGRLLVNTGAVEPFSYGQVTTQLENVIDKDNISEYARPHIAINKGLGILEGNQNGEFNPKKSATRAEVATILDRFINLVISE